MIPTGFPAAPHLIPARTDGRPTKLSPHASEPPPAAPTRHDMKPTRKPAIYVAFTTPPSRNITDDPTPQPRGIRRGGRRPTADATPKRENSNRSGMRVIGTGRAGGRTASPSARQRAARQRERSTQTSARRGGTRAGRRVAGPGRPGAWRPGTQRPGARTARGPATGLSGAHTHTDRPWLGRAARTAHGGGRRATGAAGRRANGGRADGAAHARPDDRKPSRCRRVPVTGGRRSVSQRAHCPKPAGDGTRDVKRRGRRRASVRIHRHRSPHGREWLNRPLQHCPPTQAPQPQCRQHRNPTRSFPPPSHPLRAWRSRHRSLPSQPPPSHPMPNRSPAKHPHPRSRPPRMGPTWMSPSRMSLTRMGLPRSCLSTARSCAPPASVRVPPASFPLEGCSFRAG
jgi:hypothetical protein